MNTETNPELAAMADPEPEIEVTCETCPHWTRAGAAPTGYCSQIKQVTTRWWGCVFHPNFAKLRVSRDRLEEGLRIEVLGGASTYAKVTELRAERDRLKEQWRIEGHEAACQRARANHLQAELDHMKERECAARSEPPGGGRESPTLDELAESQNVKPMGDVRALFGTWPGEEGDGSDDFDHNAPPILETFAKIMADVPPEELARHPSDGAAEHDKYLYGQ